MIDQGQAMMAADRTAGAVWALCGGPQAFGWRDGLRRHGRAVPVSAMVGWLYGNRAAPASALYAWATAGDHQARAWHQVPPVLRVSIETFRATYLILIAEMEAGSFHQVVSEAEPSGDAAALVRADDHVAAPAAPAEARAAAVPSRARLLDTDEPRAPSGPALDFDTEVSRLERQWDEQRRDGRPAKRRRD